MSTPIGQLGGTSSTKSADVELIESQLMNNQAATLPNREMGTVQAPRVDSGALATAAPPVAFPSPATPHYGYPAHPPPATPPPTRSTLDEYAFPVSLFIITVIVLSPYVDVAMKRFLPAMGQRVWVVIAIKAVLVTAGFVVLDKLNQ